MLSYLRFTQVLEVMVLGKDLMLNKNRMRHQLHEMIIVMDTDLLLDGSIVMDMNLLLGKLSIVLAPSPRRPLLLL